MSAEPPEERPVSTETTDPPASRLQEIERILVRCEGEIRGLKERTTALEGMYRMGRRRALWYRLGLLLLLLSIYVLLRSRYAGGG